MFDCPFDILSKLVVRYSDFVYLGSYLEVYWGHLTES